MPDQLKTESENKITQPWLTQVDSKYVYRGMNATDLQFPLDPAKRPFQTVLPLLSAFLDIIDALIAKGVVFDVVETHFGNTCIHGLRNIVKWTRRDLSTQGIHFTSKYQSAREYSDCWQGSQLKQNIKFISEYLLQKKDSPEFTNDLKETDWKIIHKTFQWVMTVHPNSAPIVLWVQRDKDVFKETPDPLPIASEEYYCSLLKPLEKDQIDRIEYF
jgi:hypothetical protein